MTAVPEPVSWTAPGPGLWMWNFRLGEWLPEAVTPLFGTWLLPVLEDGYLDGMRASVGTVVPFRYALVNGWYYNAIPIPSPRLLARVLWQGRWHAVKVLYNALIRVSRDPAAADRAVLSDLDQQWRQVQLPRYQRLVAEAEAEASTARRTVLVRPGRRAGPRGRNLPVVPGDRRRVGLEDGSPTDPLRPPAPGRCAARRARRRPSAAAGSARHPAPYCRRTRCKAPTGTTRSPPNSPPRHVPPTTDDRHAQLADERTAAEQACRSKLAAEPRLLIAFEQLLHVSQRYAIIREEQARDFTLAWPVLRTCVRRLGEHLGATGALPQPDDIFFCTRVEVLDRLVDAAKPIDPESVADRRRRWQHQRGLDAPLTLGKPVRLIGDVIERAAQEARGPRAVAAGVIIGHPASAGRATGRVRIVHGPDDFTDFRQGEIFVAKATAPAWTPLFAKAAAVVTDSGTLAAHASLVAREYGVPAVVGTGDATTRLRQGQTVTVDGTAGTVTLEG